MPSLYNSIINQLRFDQSVLTLSHSDYTTSVGGSEKVIRTECAFFQKHFCHYLHIFPITNAYPLTRIIGEEQIVGINFDGEKIGYYPISEVINSLKNINNQNKVFFSLCHIHHLMGFSEQNIFKILNILQMTKIMFYLHDFYTICPQHNLMFNNNVFCHYVCEKPDHTSKCFYFSEHTSQLASLHQFFSAFSIQFICPSEICRHIWLQQYPEYKDNISIIPHQIIEKSPRKAIKQNSNHPIRIAYVGYESDLKGFRIWQELVGILHHLGYEFYHIGRINSHIKSVIHIPINLDKDGNNNVSDIIRSRDIHMVLLYSLCPETYSFTFYESLVGGAYILTSSKSGNIADRVLHYQCGRVFYENNELHQFLMAYYEVSEIITKYRSNAPEYLIKNNNTLLLQEYYWLNENLFNLGITRKKFLLSNASCSNKHAFFNRIIIHFFIPVVQKYDGFMIKVEKTFVKIKYKKEISNFLDMNINDHTLKRVGQTYTHSIVIPNNGSRNEKNSNIDNLMNNQTNLKFHKRPLNADCFDFFQLLLSLPIIFVFKFYLYIFNHLSSTES